MKVVMVVYYGQNNESKMEFPLEECKDTKNFQKFELQTKVGTGDSERVMVQAYTPKGWFK